MHTGATYSVTENADDKALVINVDPEAPHIVSFAVLIFYWQVLSKFLSQNVDTSKGRRRKSANTSLLIFNAMLFLKINIFSTLSPIIIVI